MASGRWIRWGLTAATCGALTLGPPVSAFAQRGNDFGARPALAHAQTPYDAGFQEGARQGERDARSGRDSNFERDDIYRAGDRGYERGWGSRDTYRQEFRRGFAGGYRQGYDSVRIKDRRTDRRDDSGNRRWGRGYQEPATSHGYSDGYDKGRDDGRDRDRYDPVRHNDYRSADNGFYREYGSRDAYKNNYRSGFRQGYEDGYRDGGGRR